MVALTTDRFRDGAACREAREELGVTQIEMAEICRANIRTIRRHEQIGATAPYRAALDAFLRLHRIGLSWDPRAVPLGETWEFCGRVRDLVESRRLV